MSFSSLHKKNLLLKAIGHQQGMEFEGSILLTPANSGWTVTIDFNAPRSV